MSDIFLILYLFYVFQDQGFLGSRFFRVLVFQGSGFSGSRFFWVQVFQGPGFSEFGSWVQVQVLAVAIDEQVIFAFKSFQLKSYFVIVFKIFYHERENWFSPPWFYQSKKKNVVNS